MTEQSALALYRNSKGDLVTHGSYSARETFRYCPRRFYLNRVEGWRPIEERAATLFGKANEAAHQWYEESGRESGAGVAKFVEVWNRVRDLPNFKRLIFKEGAEDSWEGLLRTGREMQRLYEIAVPDLPISIHPKPRFQVPLRKEIFPGTELAGISNTAYIDILSYPRWNHPALKPIMREENAHSEYRPLIIDAKTGSSDLPVSLVGLDPQLAEYAWQSRHPDVAFLWFVKNSHKLERRNRVTLLERVDGMAAGTELFVLGYDRPEQPKKPRKKKGDPPLPPPPPVSKEIIRVYLGDAWAQERYYEAVRGLNANSDAYAVAAHTFFQARFVIACAPSQITKQRLQFAAVRIDEQTINEIGLGVGQDTVQMIAAHRAGFYPRTGGVRFPNNKCTFCEMRGICSGNAELRDKLLTRTGEEWFAGTEED